MRQLSNSFVDDPTNIVTIAIIAAIVIGIVVLISLQRKRFNELSPEEKEKIRKQLQDEVTEFEYGPVNAPMICPHCSESGCVRTKPIKQKKGISGAKATGALLTAGYSILATGLSRKENNTQARCDNCENVWYF